MSQLQNPAQAGSFSFDSIVYAAPGLNYGSNPALGQFTDFDQPDAEYLTRRLDVSAFADLGASTPWPFTNTDVPINGLARVPRGAGPFPLALFAHGNHDPLENSTPGYLYLCELLSSHGVLAATIDVNFLNGFNFGENDGRAIVHLEHVRQFALWNQRPGHPLHGKVDLSRILLVGHSRGGEAVGHASLFNRLALVQPDALTPPVPLDGSAGLGPYQFSLRGLVAIAPTDQQYVPLTGPTRVRDNYLVLHGSRDGDVFNFPGYQTYDRSHPLDPADPLQAPEGYKALLWVHRANHNFFNSVWGQEAGIPTLNRAEQEQLARVVIGALARAELRGEPDYLQVLQNHRVAEQAGWLPAGVTLVSQFQPTHRLFVQHFEEPGTALQVSAPAVGTVDSAVATVQKLRFMLGSSSHLFQDASGVRFDWTDKQSRYALDLDPQSLKAGKYDHFSVRVGQSFEPNNPPGGTQDFRIVFHDGTKEVAVRVGDVQRLAFPDNDPGIGTQPKTVMQTVRVPLDQLRRAGLDTDNLRRVALAFDQTGAGTVYLDDVQLCS